MKGPTGSQQSAMLRLGRTVNGVGRVGSEGTACALVSRGYATWLSVSSTDEVRLTERGWRFVNEGVR